MRAYFDSSVLVSILLNDKNTPLSLQWWKAYEERVSSSLFEAECLIVLRRTAEHYGKKLPASWLGKQEERLKIYLEEIGIKQIDSDVMECIWKEKKLAGCRTLDAIHVATALLFQSSSETPLILCTHDDDMKKIARQVGLKTSSTASVEKPLT